MSRGWAPNNASVYGVVGIGSGIHECHVIRCAGHGDVLVVDRRTVCGAVDVDLSALCDINLVITAHIGDAGGVAKIRLEHRDGIRRRVVHGKTAVGLASLEALALVAFGSPDPQRVVVAEKDAADSTWLTIADRSRSASRIVCEIDDRQIAGEEAIG